MEKIIFQIPDSDDSVEFYVVEQTKINGVTYILVTEEEDGDCDALILKDTSREDDTEAVYQIVEDEEELEYMSKIFISIMEDVDITM